MAALPALQAVRALTMFDTLPAGCGVQFVPDDRFAPHLKAGEVAVISADDREPVMGEIYVVTIDSPLEPEGYVLRIVQLRSRRFHFVEGEDVGWMMHFSLIQCRTELIRTYGSMTEALRHPSALSLCDGPLLTDGMRRKIVGRVVGVMSA